MHPATPPTNPVYPSQQAALNSLLLLNDSSLSPRGGGTDHKGVGFDSSRKQSTQKKSGGESSSLHYQMIPSQNPASQGTSVPSTSRVMAVLNQQSSTLSSAAQVMKTPIKEVDHLKAQVATLKEVISVME